MNSANMVMLGGLVAMVALWIWLFRDGEGPLGRPRTGVKRRRLLPGPQIRIQVAEPSAELAPETDHLAEQAGKDEASRS